VTTDPAEEAAVDRIAELLRRQIGLRPEANLRGRLRRSIRDEAAAHDGDLDAYQNVLLASPASMQSLVNRVTVQETHFFRHVEHFEVLGRDILPSLTPPVTLWSAACSNGQEAYSLAILLDELRIAGAVVATDLSTSAVKRTAAGRYATRELTGLSPERIARHLTHGSHGWRINDNIRSRVTTMQHNLLEPIPEIARPSQVVFCRNVLIYFSREHARAFVTRLADQMPTAAVFLGSAEAMWPISHRFETVHTGETFYYRPRSAAAARRAMYPGDLGRAGAVPAPRSQGQPSDGHAPTGRTHAEASRASLRPDGSVRSDGGVRSGGVVRSDAGARPDGSHRSSAHHVGAPRAPVRPARTARPPTDRPAPDSMDPVALSRIGQQALDAGDYAAAVIAFRKCAYLTPDSAVAHLHLGLALEASGDLTSARRAFRASRRAALHPASPDVEDSIGGYATSELLRLLDAKQQMIGR
jgi:chemotaxis protein methyltransferase CheR